MDTQPAYPTGLPTSAGAMLAYLYRTSHGQNPPAVEAFITAGDLIQASYLRPAVLAALFGALEKIPGVSVADHAANAAGLQGVGPTRHIPVKAYALLRIPSQSAQRPGK